MQLRTKYAAFSPEDFCAALAAELVRFDRRSIPIGDPKVEAVLREIVSKLHREAVAAFESDEDLAHTILNVLEGISPNPNTGAFDEFWSKFRQLQPSPMSAPNPFFPGLKIGYTDARAEDEVGRLPDEWRPFVTEFAQSLARAL
jgi:hypothetical protein